MLKITKSLAIITIAIAAVAGATYAYYHDDVTVAGATFTADTMYLKVDSDASRSNYVWSDEFTVDHNPFANLKPGSTGHQVFDIKNVGHVDGNATIKFHVAADTPLYHNMNFVVKFDADHNGTFETPVASGPLTAWNNNVYNMGKIISSETTDGTSEQFTGKIASVLIEWEVPTSAGNDIMGKSVTIDTTFGLDQVHE